jgi:hypothetical protein
MLDLEITSNLIEYVVHCTADAVEFAMNHSSGSRGRSRRNLGTFTEFVSNVVYRSEIKLPVLLATLVYIQRATPHLCIRTEDWANERVFLGAIVCAAKYTNDCTLKNVHWAICSGVFGRRDVGRMEREFIDVLDWDLSISESEILDHHDSIMALYPLSYHKKGSSPISGHHFKSSVSSSSQWSDSDSDDSSIRTPPTPASPNHPPSHVKPAYHYQKHSLSHHSYPHRLVEALQSFPFSWGNNKHTNDPTIQRTVPQLRV